MNNLLDILNKSVNYLEKKEIIDRIMHYVNFERILSKTELVLIRKKINSFIEISKKYSTDDVKKKELEILENIEYNDKKESESNKTVKVLLEKSIEYLE